MKILTRRNQDKINYQLAVCSEKVLSCIDCIPERTLDEILDELLSITVEVCGLHGLDTYTEQIKSKIYSEEAESNEIHNAFI